MENSKLGANVPIVTSVHGLQIIDEEIPMTAHDIPVTAIVTPTAAIGIDVGYARPGGIYWNMLPQEKIAAIPVLENLRRRTSG